MNAGQGGEKDSSGMYPEANSAVTACGEKYGLCEWQQSSEAGGPRRRLVQLFCSQRADSLKSRLAESNRSGGR